MKSVSPEPHRIGLVNVLTLLGVLAVATSSISCTQCRSWPFCGNDSVSDPDIIDTHWQGYTGDSGEEASLSFSVEVNPNEHTPLTALLSVSSPSPVSVKVQVPNPAHDDATIEGHFESANDHSIPILGLLPGIVNEVTVTFSTADGDQVETLEIETVPLPAYFPEIEIVSQDTARMEPGLHLIPSCFAASNGATRAAPFIMDKHGDVRWFLDGRGWSVDNNTRQVEWLEDGILQFIGHQEVFHMNLMGDLVHTFNSDVHGYKFTHHAVTSPANNLLAGAALLGKTGTDGEENEVTLVGDTIIEITRENGDLLRVWDLATVLDIDRDPNNFGFYTGDWFHLNSVFHLPEEDSLVISGARQAIVKVDGQGDLKWILAPHVGWEQAGAHSDGAETAPFLMTAVDATGTPYPEEVQTGTVDAADFSWTWVSHAATVLPNGNILAFDNGVRRNFQWHPNSESYSRAVEYEIDETAMTVRQVWEYGRERGPSFYSDISSDADHLPITGNRLITAARTTMGYGEVVEVTYPDNEVVFDSRFRFTHAENESGIEVIWRAERIQGLYVQESTP